MTANVFLGASAVLCGVSIYYHKRNDHAADASLMLAYAALCICLTLLIGGAR